MEILSYWAELIHANVKYPMVEIIGLVVAVFGFLLPWRSAYNKHIIVWCSYNHKDASILKSCVPARLFYCANTNCRTRTVKAPQANQIAFSDSLKMYQIDAYVIVGFILSPPHFVLFQLV